MIVSEKNVPLSHQNPFPPCFPDMKILSNLYSKINRLATMMMSNMKTIVIFLLALIFQMQLFAEKIDGPANVRSEPQGEKIFSLNDDVEVTCTELLDDWYRIGFVIRLTKEQYDQRRITLPAGSTLYDRNGKVMGKTLIDFTVTGKSRSGPPDNRSYSTDFIGYTYKSNIKLESIPEYVLNEVLKDHHKVINKADFEEYLQDFQFRKSGLLKRFDEDFEEFMIYENWIDDPSPMDRIRFIFKDSTLIAIIYIRDIELKNYPSLELTRGRRIIIVGEMPENEKMNFINLNIQSYAGVD